MSAVLNDQDWQVRAACRGPQIKFSFLHHILKENLINENVNVGQNDL